MDRKPWIEDRLEQFAQIFSISVAGISILDSHLRVLARLDTDVAAAWRDEEVVRRWRRLYPPRNAARQALPVTYLQDVLRTESASVDVRCRLTRNDVAESVRCVS